MNRSHAWATGGVLFAGTILILNGVFQLVQGIGAIARDNIYVGVPNYVLKLDTTAWGWIHLFVGIGVAVTGCFLLLDKVWARGVGIGLAALSAFTNFFFLPYYPLWSLILVALDAWVIWALVTAPVNAPARES
jgi:hypothetical protein